MWSAAKVSADFANNVQVEAGTIVKTFNVSNPTEPADENIICATTGDFSITCTHDDTDFFEDVNNAPNGTKEGKRISKWNTGLAVTALDVTPETLKLALGAADITAASGKVAPRTQYVSNDFQSLYWLGDMLDADKLLVVEMENVIGAGITFTAKKNGKGGLSLSLSACPTIADTSKVPMAFYILTKVETAADVTYTYTAVANPTGSPASNGYYERSRESPNYNYALSSDTEVDAEKTYYTRDA